MRSPKLKVRYVSTDGIEYAAVQSGPMNNCKTVLTSFGQETTAHDDGNGLSIKGDRLSLRLDYGQVADLYHLFKAVHDGEVHKKGLGIWNTSEAFITQVRKKRSK